MTNDTAVLLVVLFRSRTSSTFDPTLIRNVAVIAHVSFAIACSRV